jgi:pyridinium-3,5-biscarboxylic acid mononucleotide sulfurtransferase
MTITVPAALHAKWDRLAETVAGLHRIAVAFSGGVDSSFLAWCLVHALGKDSAAVLVESPFMGLGEIANARRVAIEIGIELNTITLDPLAVPAIRNNPVDRCYHCKKEIFIKILDRARALGCHAVADGSHAEDSRGHRPGKKALAELGVLSPLALAGLVKSDIRELSRLAGLSTWDKPSQSCLATRAPYGTPLTHELLARIEAAEDFLHATGCRQVRVRCHGDLARIETEPSCFADLFAKRDEVLARLRELGFSHITLDLAGFRSGSWDEGLELDNRER